MRHVPADAGWPATVAAQPGRIGHEAGVAVARHVAAGGGDTIALRLDPGDMGRIDVRLRFDDAGRLSAAVSADNPAALDMLRRDAPDLLRALTDAGVRTDAGAFRFDDRGESGGGGDGRRAWSRDLPDPAPGEPPDQPDPVPAPYRPVAPRGRVDVTA